MDTATVGFQLGESLIHLQKLVAEFHAGQIGPRDEPAISVQLGHILDHISIAWNCKDMTPEQFAALSQEDFNRLCKIVPNFLGDRIIGKFAFA